MKRPPQLWIIGIGIVCIWLLPSTQAVRATSLIFAKTSSTTSSTSTSETGASSSDETVTVSSTSESPADNQTATKPPLTGIPQIDYIWDPNLPFELKGYNLSEYPFYDRVPEEIDFKCDGLHDGFYASVPHKCQVYHHCLFGTRYDFLCANFTAFDQKTFICHFVSEVDCNNSKKFWHRNDALYQAASTTPPSTTTPQIVATPSPALNPALRRPSPLAGGLVGGLGRRRRPFRRRPAYEYYYDDLDDYDERDRPIGRDGTRERDRDDYYDDPPPRSSGSRRRKRPRPNRRPIEYDDYEEYEDERYDRRPGRRDEDRDRRPYRDDDRRYDDRRPSGKNKDRRIMPEEDETSIEDRKKPDDRRRPIDDRDDFDRRPYDRRKPSRDHFEDDKEDGRRPHERPRKTDEDKTERRPFDRPRKQDDDERRYRPKDPKIEEERRPHDRRKPDDERRYRPRNKPEDSSRSSEERIKPTEETKLVTKPSSSVYDRPRASSIIRRPVSLKELNKFESKSTVSASKSSPKPEIEEEYYDDYEEEPKPKPTRKTTSRDSEERRPSSTSRRPPGIYSRRPLSEEEERPSKRNQERFQSRNKKPVEEDYADEYEEDRSNLKGESSREKFKSKEVPTASEENVGRRPEPIIKIVKRPFLPSRGGNPFAARGLQPVGAKALDATTETIIKSVEPTAEKLSSREKYSHEDPGSSEKVKASEEEYYDEEEEIKPVTKRPAFRTLESRTTQKPKDNYRNPSDISERTTQKPKVPENYRNPLDINENEYDVTLNDALNPTLPNLPVRSVPTGFSSGREGYSSQNYQRPRLVAVESPILTASNSEFVYVKQPSTRYNPYIAYQLNRQPFTSFQ